MTIPQVRAVVAPSNDLILSSSRDSTAISWIKASDSSFSPAHTFRAGSRFINAVAYLKPTPEAPQGKNMAAGLWTTPHDGAIRRLHRYGRSRLDHKHLEHRANSRGAPVFPTGSLGQCLCFTCRGGWLHHFRVMGQVRPSLFHLPSTKLTLLCKGPPKYGIIFSLCPTSWATRSLCGLWYQ